MRAIARAEVRFRAAADVLRATYDAARHPHAFDSVQSFCLFIGYPRSGHSLVGSLLDAHPDVVLSHELDALRYVQTGWIGRRQLFSLILRRDREFTARGRRWTYGFDYSVPGQWQGRVRELLVIGDKKGGVSTRRLADDPGSLTRLHHVVEVDVKAIHVVRNPFDNIASMYLRGTGSLERCRDLYEAMCRANDSLRQRRDLSVRDLRHEELLREPRGTLARLCEYLGVRPSQPYLDDCAAVVRPSPHRSRGEVEWPAHLKAEIDALIDRYDFLRGYGFEERAESRTQERSR